MFKQLSNISKGSLWVMVACMTLLVSCTDLEETISGQVPADQFFKTDQEFIAALGDAYSPLSTWGSHNGYSSMNIISSDAGIITTKGTDWFDGGIWVRMKQHTFLPSDPEINNAWTSLYGGVYSVNRLIYQFQSLVESGQVNEADAAAFVAELKVLRAFYYYLLLDSFGNVPIVTSFADAPANPTQPSSSFQEGRAAVFNFVEQEILANIDKLDTNANATYGRVNKWVAHTILAKLYLNSKTYLDLGNTSAEYQGYLEKVVAQTDSVINSGNYTLTANYADNFVTNNSGSPELIFVVPYDKVFLPGFNLPMMTLHYASQNTYNLDAQPWNGYAAMEESYNRYIDPSLNPGPQGTVIGSDGSETTGTVDGRLTNFIVGPQYDAEGNRLMDPGATPADPNGAPITFTPEIQSLTDGLRQGGARIGKFEFEKGALSNLSNDYPIFRYADILLMKAEALWRMNSNPTEALRLVNMIRQRAGVQSFTSLSAEQILAERGREMFWEMTRRQDLIRFEGEQGATEFNDPWEFKQASDEYRNVFPIPLDQLEANTSLVQNPGY